MLCIRSPMALRRNVIMAFKQNDNIIMDRISDTDVLL